MSLVEWDGPDAFLDACAAAAARLQEPIRLTAQEAGLKDIEGGRLVLRPFPGPGNPSIARVRQHITDSGRSK